MDSPSSSLPQPSASTSATPSQGPSASAAAPQIRSRITVVCAECKRLKLKCDRRSPCGSCTKRDTVVRCIYSPAAAEKVDLHSLHNRLIHVESFISLMSSGQQPPPFQSSYPLPYPSTAAASIASSSSAPTSSFNLNFSGNPQTHQHHHHYAPPPLHPSANTIALSQQDFATIWLDALDLGIPFLSPPSPAQLPLPNHAYPHGQSAGYIKLEPSAIDVALSVPHSGAPGIIDVDNNAQPLRQSSRPASPFLSARRRRGQQNHSVQLLLPALSIYYPVPSIAPPGSSSASSSAFPHHPSANVLHLPQQHQPQYAKPQVTPALLALLPSQPRCRRLLNTARDVFRVRPIPFEPGTANEGAWKAFESRCFLMLSGGFSEEREKEREKREKAREAKKARQIYFSGISGLQPEDTEMDDASGTAKNKDAEEQNAASQGQSLTFFALMCAVLAIGAYTSSSSNDLSTSESPAFFYALSQQALGVRDTHVSSTSSSSNFSSAADEAERMDYLLACLAGVEYLMLSGAGDEREEANAGASQVATLVGKLVNAQRNMGLDREVSSSKKSKNAGPMTPAMSKRLEKERLREEWRKMVLWQVMYCDLFTADTLGHQPCIPPYSYSAKLPSCSCLPSSETSGSGSEPEAGYDSPLSPDDMLHDGYDGPSSNANSTRQRRRQQTHPQSTLPSLTSGVDEETNSYLGARYRLTQLAQAVKDRVAHPDCCCGYTLELATALEEEVRKWHAGLPASLRTAVTAAAGESASSPEPTHPKGPFHDLLPPDGSRSGSAAVLDEDKAALARSCELVIMVNLLILKIYSPFLRHAASSASAVATNGSAPSSTAQSSASGGGVNSTACQASVHAAQSILRISKVVSSLFNSRCSLDLDHDVVLPSIFDYHPLGKVVFEAVVTCAHAGLTGKAATFALDVGMLMDDVYAGLGLLSDMLAGNGLGSGLEEKHKRVVEVLYKRVQHRGGNAGLLKRKHDQVDTTGPFGSSSTYSSNGNEESLTAGFDLMSSGGAAQYQSNGLSNPQQQHANLFDTPFASMSPTTNSQGTPMSAGGFPTDRLERSDQRKNELDSALTSGSTIHLTASAAAKEKAKERDQQDQQREKEKGQKQSKKSHGYPSVGIRVRPGKESPLTSSRSRQHSASASASSGSGAAQRSPLTPTAAGQQQKAYADSVLAFQQQQRQNLQQPGAPMVPENEVDPQRSRSSSFTHIQSQARMEQQGNGMNYGSLPFGPVPPSNPDPTDSAHNNTSDTGRQIQQHQVSPEQPPFSSRPFDQSRPLFDGLQQQYDQPTAVSTAMSHTDGLNYGNTVSSPFSPSAGPPSSTGSPFTSASAGSSGHPPTPTFNAHHPTPPVFGPQPTPTALTSNSATYYLPNSFSNSYTRSPPSELSGHHRNASLMDMGVDQTMLPSTSLYDKAHQQQQIGMYDMKPSIDPQSQHHHMLQQSQHHMQNQAMGPANSYENQNMPGQHSLAIPPHPPWPSSSQQQTSTPQASQNYWDMGPSFRFSS